MQHSENIEDLREELLHYIDRLNIPQLRLVLSFIKHLFTF